MSYFTNYTFLITCILTEEGYDDQLLLVDFKGIVQFQPWILLVISLIIFIILLKLVFHSFLIEITHMTTLRSREINRVFHASRITYRALDIDSKNLL